MANNMLYSLVLSAEDGEEIESVVLNAWILDKTMFYPNGLHVKKYHRNCAAPEPHWPQYDLIKIKCTGMCSF